ncbi:glycosyltransferase family 2 protein [Flavihumibacter sp. CACIAM 22H1]|uniref:glycosyltransferase family 2 protein n=1 Tax=Flavihumibacter sp. CACIAM 22H1 TaxID=1812911 RepID=UPI0007A91FE4|nr:glycosyltransferase family 2 protein [Flavihumibacter sp. CACIAM 22H1]KYP15119.1 MAG: hypothetical protein A1D16_12470 [Flavihumibacter sp. CACIAM 22H1]
MRNEKEPILVSIIMPVYNTGKYLQQALDSIISQHYKNFEVFLVDDGSTDGSLDICRYAAAADSRFKVISQINAGSGAARNRGIQASSGELLYFMDSDDWIEPGLIGIAVQKFIAKPYDLLVFGYTKVAADGSLIASVQPPDIQIENLPAEHEKLASLFMCGVGLAVWDKVFSAACIKSNNVIFGEKKRTQDFGFMMDLLPQVKQVQTCSQWLYNYRIVFNINRKFDDKIVANHIENYKRIVDFFRDDLTNKTVASYLLKLRTLWFGIVVPINIVAVNEYGSFQKRARIREMLTSLKECKDAAILKNGLVQGKFSFLNALLNRGNPFWLYCCATLMQISRRKLKIAN